METTLAVFFLLFILTTLTFTPEVIPLTHLSIQKILLHSYGYGAKFSNSCKGSVSEKSWVH